MKRSACSALLSVAVAPEFQVTSVTPLATWQLIFAEQLG